jgi:hypothetical protein
VRAQAQAQAQAQQQARQAAPQSVLPARRRPAGNPFAGLRIKFAATIET